MHIHKIVNLLKGLYFISSLHLLLLLLLIFNASNAFADFYVIAGSKGVGTKINSLPYTIASSGFYYIAQDLSCSTATGITINADDVTLDLMGFCLDGTGGAPGTYRGIYMDARKNIEIRNGTIKHFNSGGIFGTSTIAGGTGHRIINVRFEDNHYGILLDGRGHLVEKCTVVNNSSTGIGICGGPWNIDRGGSIVTGNICYGNSGSGISLGEGSGSIVTNNSCYDNGEIGILASPGFGNIVKGNGSYNNYGTGILVNIGASVIGNTCYSNGKTGIFYGIHSFGGMVDQNAIYDNGSTGSYNLYSGTGGVVGNNYIASP